MEREELCFQEQPLAFHIYSAVPTLSAGDVSQRRHEATHNLQARPLAICIAKTHDRGGCTKDLKGMKQALGLGKLGKAPGWNWH